MDLEFQFAMEAAPRVLSRPWTILIADDEPEVHNITKLTLRDHLFYGRPVRFLDAYSGAEAVEILRSEHDVALLLLDVVMESEHAGLLAVQAIRKQLGNHLIRIILRTGHPGQAPEHDVVTRYDINGYKEKTELTAQKLFTLIHTTLGHYRELTALEQHRAGLEKVIDASATILEHNSKQLFLRGALQQLNGMIFAAGDSQANAVNGFAAVRDAGSDLKIVSAHGCYERFEGQSIQTLSDAVVREAVTQAVVQRRSILTDHHFVGFLLSPDGYEQVLFLSGEAPATLVDQRLIELFCRNVAIASENLALHQKIITSQRQVIILLVQAIEERSRETGNHVNRVVEYSLLLGRLLALSDEDLDLLSVASALHDIGKVAIPDAILHKAGKLEPGEWETMQTHARRGEKLLNVHDGELMQAGAIVAGQHHERWDGNGYPDRLREEQIHVFARITALMDVFDALTSRRCYKEPWTVEAATEYLRQQRGRQFDPHMVDLMLENLDGFLEIRERLPDPPPH